MYDALQVPGVSGITVDIPRLRVDLQQWCEWTGADWSKVCAVVGSGFRMCARDENAYTMAANAVLDLIVRYDVDPRNVGFLGLGTESSTDNSAGAVIVKGMVDEGLVSRGLPPLARDCEVPEFKQACLGGIYALKGAVRYVAVDGQDRVAIVVSSDIAEYERGSTGEQTQGAGAVAMLVERRPKLFGVDLSRGASASDYRGFDFRKPMARHFVEGYTAGVDRVHDFPVFNGSYSTACYADEVAHAVERMLARVYPAPADPRPFLESLGGVFLHRPYQHMPVQAMAIAIVWTAARRGASDWLEELCAAAGVDRAALEAEVVESPRLFAQACLDGGDEQPLPLVTRAAKALRKSTWFKEFRREKMSLGSSLVQELGNLYTASLPGWLAAAFEDALERNLELAGKTLMAVGYGSGDAAEALPLIVAPGWREAARKIKMRDALADPLALERQAYEDLHDGRPAGWARQTRRGFVVERTGDRLTGARQDVGMEYYRRV